MIKKSLTAMRNRTTLFLKHGTAQQLCVLLGFHVHGACKTEYKTTANRRS